MNFTQSPQFYSLMFRNLGVLRDIQKVISDAREKRQAQIVFRDENGVVWQLKQVGSDKQAPKFDTRQKRISHQPNWGNLNYR